MALAVNLLRDQEGRPMAGQTKAEQRIYRTVSGELVRENDPRGAYLAYPVGEPIRAGEVDAYRQLVDGDPGKHEVPGLMHDRLATAIADAQRVLANSPSEAAAQAAIEQLDEAARVVDAGAIPPPAPAAAAAPTEIVRAHAAGEGDRPATTAATAEPTEAKESPVHDDDQPPAGDKTPAETKRATSARGTKAAAKPADKATPAPGDK